jgi:hypothetical protein
MSPAEMPTKTYPQHPRHVLTIHKVDRAVNHVDWAIRLVVDHGAFDVAITLAGAADEVLGKATGDRPAFRDLRARLQELSGLPADIVADEHLNKLRNWMKHPTIEIPQTLQVDLEADAAQMIIRCLINLLRIGELQRSDWRRFLAWLRATRPDIANPEAPQPGSAPA